MFRSCRNKGFHMTFENGWTISVQWGRENYCEQVENEADGTHLAKDAEIAAWHVDGTDLLIEDSGWRDTNYVAKWITKVSEMARPGRGGLPEI